MAEAKIGQDGGDRIVSADASSRPAPRAALLSREDEAKLALEHTVISSNVQWFLVVLFLLTIFSVPMIQHVGEILEIRAGRSGRTMPQIYDIFRSFSRLSRIGEVRSLREAVDLLPTVAEINAYEKELEDNSVVAHVLLPFVQSVLTGVFGAGNEEAYCGLGKWLYYRPEIDYVTGRGFLEPKVLLARSRGGDRSEDAVQPDPVKGIVHFRDQLAARGIGLVIMPVPVKPVIHPEHFSHGVHSAEIPVQNPSYAAFLQSMRSEAIPVFDVSVALKTAAAVSGESQFLETDTHWTPDAMASAAETLAEFLKRNFFLAPDPGFAWTRETVKVANLGDIAVMLKLPEAQTLYPKQEVEIQQVRASDGALWEPSPKADILLLGDSFSNIYSMGGMGWGEGAGFAAQLSWFLRRPVDAITMNAGGSFSSRRELANRLARGQDPLAGKRVVVYQFAMRDLSVGDWKIITLPDAVRKSENTESATPATSATSVERFSVTGTIQSVATPPQPGSVPYKDCIVALHLKEVRALSGGEDGMTEILVYVWGMRENKLTPITRFQAGQKVSLSLVPWATVEKSYGGYNRMELDDFDLLLLNTYWGELQ